MRLNNFVSRLRAIPSLHNVGVFILVIIASYGLGRLVMNPSMIRLLLFGVLFLAVVSFSIRQPRLLLYGMLLYLPMLGFIRRWLIPQAGWSGFDPLVVLAPAAVLLLGSYWLYNIYVKRHPIEQDSTLFTWTRYLLFIFVLQVFNPLQGSLMVGLGGVIFYIVPLAWMLAGRIYMTHKWMKRIFGTLVGMGVVSLLYSMKQVNLGFADFEQTWIELSGYAALMVGQSPRGFSFFTSAAEYAQYILFGTIICWATMLRGSNKLKATACLLLPLFFYALLLTGSRAPLLLAVIAISAMTIMCVEKVRTRFIVGGFTVVAVVFLYQFLISIDAGDNALIARQVNGFANPTDEEHSTLGLHLDYFIQGLSSGLTNPIGTGLGSTTLAGLKFSDGGSNSEVDISNIIMSTGLIGGMIYLAIIIQIVQMAFRRCRDSGVTLCIFGILLGSMGSWLIGGNYSTVAIIWLCIGYLDRYAVTANSKAIAEVKKDDIGYRAYL